MSVRSGLLGNWRVSVPLVFCLVLTLLLAFVVFHYFFLTFTVAVSLALMLGPAHRRLTARFGGRAGLSASVLVVVCLVALLVPLYLYATLLVQQAVDVVTWVRPRLEPVEIEKLWSRTLPQRYPLVMAWIRQLTGGASAMASLSAGLSQLASSANHLVQDALTGLVALFLDFGLFVMMLFFLLRDGELLRESLRGISPLTRGQETELLTHLTRTVKGVLMSMIVVPVVQGALAFPAFWMLGVPKPHLWSLMVVFAAVIPVLGSPLAWVPVALYLFFSVSATKGIILFVYGSLVISGIDNLIKPIILRNAAQIHTMLAFLSILGGVYAFGPKGLIAGPMVLSLVLSAYRIYRYDVLRWRALPGSLAEVQPPPETPPPRAPEAVLVAEGEA
jgi:predicted PurR-regulated permease PerM